MEITQLKKAVQETSHCGAMAVVVEQRIVC